jgi:hypothetical protein
VLAGEVLIGKLLTVDRLTTSTLDNHQLCSKISCRSTYIATGEVTTLKHELGDYAVEGRSRVSEILLAGAKSTEVLGCLRNDIVVEVEYDTAGLLCG